MRAALIHEYKLTTLERVLAVALFMLGVGIKAYISGTTWFSSGTSIINNPGFFPQIVGYGIMLISVILFLSTLKKDRGETVTINWFGVLIVAVWVLFGILCSVIGFILSGIIALFATLVLFGAKNKMPVILTSILAPVLLYVFLSVLLGVRLPTLFL